MTMGDGTGLQPSSDKYLITDGGTIVTLTIDVKNIGSKDEILREALRMVIAALVDEESDTDPFEGITASYLEYRHGSYGRSLPPTKKR